MIILYNITRKFTVEIIKGMRSFGNIPFLIVYTRPSFELLDFIGKIGMKHILVARNSEDEAIIEKIRKIIL